MKRWHIITRNTKKCVLASLVSMDAKAKSCVLKTDSDTYLRVKFDEYSRYPFGEAKEGKEKLAAVSVVGENAAAKRIIVFK